MKRGSILFLQIIVVLIGIGALTFMLWEPQIEGVNAHATFSQIYFDPFVIYMYAASIAFFVAIFQALKLLQYIRQDKALSPDSVKALQIIKYSAITFVVLIAAPVVYLFIARPGDDIAGGVAVGLFIIFVSTIVAVVSGVFEKVVQSTLK